LLRLKRTRRLKRREQNGGQCACWYDGAEMYVCRNHRAAAGLMAEWSLVAVSASAEDES
jgi:hypothetical protein